MIPKLRAGNIITLFSRLWICWTHLDFDLWSGWIIPWYTYRGMTLCPTVSGPANVCQLKPSGNTHVKVERKINFIPGVTNSYRETSIGWISGKVCPCLILPATSSPPLPSLSLPLYPSLSLPLPLLSFPSIHDVLPAFPLRQRYMHIHNANEMWTRYIADSLNHHCKHEHHGAMISIYYYHIVICNMTKYSALCSPFLSTSRNKTIDIQM